MDTYTHFQILRWRYLQLLMICLDEIKKDTIEFVVYKDRMEEHLKIKFHLYLALVIVISAWCVLVYYNKVRYHENLAISLDQNESVTEERDVRVRVLMLGLLYI